jgi:glycosyltransferase involved in cell wall biosynthesis
MLKKSLLSVIVPVYNEAPVLSTFHQRLTKVLQTLSLQCEIIYINDGSVDNSLDILQLLSLTDSKIAIVDLSRNFGKEIALAAGIDYATGDAIILIDADLQDPPELIPNFIHYWQSGYDVVYGKRTSRKGETWFKKTSAHLFYRILHKISRISIPIDTGDFRLLSRRAVNAFKQLREKHRFSKGLFAWIGFSQIDVPYERGARISGISKWSYRKLWNLALEGITSFSIAPLKLATYLGFLTAFAAFLYALAIVYKTLVWGDPIQGYPSLMVVMLFLGGIQLVTLGIMGEYLGRTFSETKHRPLYFIKSYHPALQINEQPMNEQMGKQSEEKLINFS